jgi:hypothetical protein
MIGWGKLCQQNYNKGILLIYSHVNIQEIQLLHNLQIILGMKTL